MSTNITKTAKGLVEYCKAQLGLPYWFGTYGQRATASLYWEKKAQYPAEYTADNFFSQIGERVHDCVGLIKGYLWSATPDSTPVYVASEDVNVPMLYNRCNERGTMGNMPDEPGVCVFMADMSHVGVYIGNGEVIEARGHAYGVIKTQLKGRGWACWGKPKHIDYSETEGAPVKKSHYKGVDISWWNKDVDMAAAKADGLDFAIIRAGYGDNNVDSYAEPNAKRAKEAGVDVGYYWFSYADTVEQAAAEADYLCDEVERIGVTPTYPLCFDYEYDSEEKYPPKESIVEIARAFLKRVAERGYHPCNYTNIDYLNRGFDQLTDEFDTWLAQWGVDAPTKDCTIWQYSSKAVVDGVNGVVDADICYVDYPAIIAGDDSEVKPEPKPEPDPTPSEPEERETCMTDLPILRKVSYNAMDPAVKSLQLLLIGWGYSCGNSGADGVFGNATEEAVKKFQKEYGLTVDGVVGSKTWRKLIWC